MKQTKRNFFFLVALWLASTATLKAQTSVNSGGGSGTGGGGTVTYSIAQVAYSSPSGTGGSLLEGVQHAYEILTVGQKEQPLVFSLSVHPNPVANILKIQSKNVEDEAYSYELYDVQGKLVYRHPVRQGHTEIDFSCFSPAMYLLHVLNDQNQKVQTFKIIKK